MCFVNGTGFAEAGSTRLAAIGSRNRLEHLHWAPAFCREMAFSESGALSEARVFGAGSASPESVASLLVDNFLSGVLLWRRVAIGRWGITISYSVQTVSDSI